MGINKAALKAYERRLLEDKKQLHKLMYESDNSADQFPRRKLEFYENELKYMQNQYTRLYIQVTGQMPEIAKDENYSLVNYDSAANKNMVGTHLAPDGTPVSAVTVARDKAKASEAVNANEIVKANETVKASTESVAATEGAASVASTVSTESATTAKVTQEPPVMQEFDTYEVKEIPDSIKSATTSSEEEDTSFTDSLDMRDLETFIGKNFMGIAASVLIFIAVIGFAGLVLPKITDEIKMLAMYILGAIFLAFGFVRIGKNKEDRFALILLGCGAGVLYVSLILSNIYFKAIGDIPLYVLILLWSLGVVFLSRYKSVLFMAIGYIGITISMAFGAVSCSDTHDASMLVALFIFYIISAGVFNVAFYNKDIVKNAFNHVMNTINVIILYNGVTNCLEQEGVHISSVLLIVITIVALGLLLSSQLEEDAYFILPICLVANMGFLCAELGFAINEEVMGIIIYLISMAVLVILDRKKWDIQTAKIVAMVISMVYVMVGIYQIDVLREHCVPLMVVVPFLAYGYYRRDSVLKYGALAVFAGYEYLTSMQVGLDMAKVSSLEIYGVGLVVLAAMYLCIYFFKSQYNRTYKYIVHGLGCIHLLFIGYVTFKFIFDDGNIGFGIAYIMATIFNLIMLKVFCKDYENNEEEDLIVYIAINAILMIFALFTISIITVEPLHIMIIMTSIAAYMVNCKNILENQDNIWGGIYVGGKFTVLLIVSLASFEADGFLISISCFVFAIISIAIGFWRRYKSLRIFGLVLSMLSIFKLIVVDLSTGDTMGNVISFFSAGIVCLAISMLYNYIDKKIPKE